MLKFMLAKMIAYSTEKKHEGLSKCPTYGLCIWKKRDGIVDQYKKGIPAKVL